MIRTGQFRYVAHGRVFEMMAAGWMLAGDLGPTHGTWSVLMWRCDCLGDDNA